MKLFAKQISKLTMRNADYRDFTIKLLDFLLEQDVGEGDKTARLLANPNAKLKAKISAKENGVLCGAEEVSFFFRKAGLKVSAKKRDGELVKRGEIILLLVGSAQKILACERVALNLLQRMSGIATVSHRLAKQIGKGKFSATRKTPYGLLDTRAVVAGGGLPHRLNLADMILVKENHIQADKNCWKKILSPRKRGSIESFCEIEANNEKLATQIATHFAKNSPHDKRGVGGVILLLDNFTPRKLQALVPKLRKINPKIILEGSGGITAKNAKQFLDSGVDYISLGEITHSPRAMDFSLKVF